MTQLSRAQPQSQSGNEASATVNGLQMTALPTTPDEIARWWYAIRASIIKLGPSALEPNSFVVPMTENILVALIAELGLNQRTLFIDEARYGKRPTMTPMTTGAATPSPVSPTPAAPSEARSSPLADKLSGPLPEQPKTPDGCTGVRMACFSDKKPCDEGTGVKDGSRAVSQHRDAAMPAGPSEAPPKLPQGSTPLGRSVEDIISMLDDKGGLPPDMFSRWCKLGKGRYPVSKQARIAALTALTDGERYTLMTGGRA